MKNKTIALLILSICLNFNLTHAAAVSSERQLSEVVRTLKNNCSEVIRISDDRFATYSKNVIKIWDIDREECITELNHTYEIAKIISLDNNNIVSLDKSGLIKVWDLISFTEKRSLQSQLHGCFKLCKLDHNKFILSDYIKNEIWDLCQDDENAMIHSCYSKVIIITLSYNRIAIFNIDRSLSILNLKNGDLLEELENWGNMYEWTSRGISIKDGIIIASLSNSINHRDYLSVIDIDSESIIKQKIPQKGYATALLRLDDNKILVGYQNGEIKILGFKDYATPPEEKLIFSGDPDECIKELIDLGSNYVVAKSDKNIIRIFNLDLLDTCPLDTHQSYSEIFEVYECIVRLSDCRFIVYNRSEIQVRQIGLVGLDAMKGIK